MTSWDSLSPSQKAAVLHEEGPAAVYAGPGSGKTRVVTLRAVRLAQQAKRLLVTTFTSDATAEMKARIDQSLGAVAGAAAHVTTMHALCLQILRQNGTKFQLLTDEFLRRNLAETAQAAELEGGVPAFLTKVSYLKNTGSNSATYKHDGSAEDIEFARAWRSFEKAKSEKGFREFDDLILDAATLIEKDADVRRFWSERYSHIIVDECQDMNSPQYAVAFALGRDHKNVMLVGDLDQSLYSFRGADTSTFKHFAAHPRTAVYELRENYRCTQAILTFADNLIRQDTERRALSFVPTREQGDPVTWERYPDPDIEALAVGEQIMRLVRRGAEYREVAVLYRTNAQSEAFERHFAALEIPFTIREDGDFYSRKEIQGMLAYLNFFDPPRPRKAPVKPAPKRGAKQAMLPPTGQTEAAERGPERNADEWLLALLNVPNRKLSKMVGSQLRNHAEIRGKRIWDILPEFHAAELKEHRALRQLQSGLQRIAERLPEATNAGEAVRMIRAAMEFDAWLRRDEGNEKDNDRIQNLQRMQAAAAHYGTIHEYLEAVQKVRDEASRRKAERAKKRREQNEVTLSTGHAAKGLEWRYVFAVGWSEDILPHRKAEDMTEELRIAYVIATRARDLLSISSLDSWNDATAAPSRFLTGLQLAGRPPVEEEEEVEALPAAPEEEGAFGGLFLTL